MKKGVCVVHDTHNGFVTKPISNNLLNMSVFVCFTTNKAAEFFWRSGGKISGR